MLQCCPNGARPADVYPAVPMTPRHLARDARAVAALGCRASTCTRVTSTSA